MELQRVQRQIHRGIIWLTSKIENLRQMSLCYPIELVFYCLCVLLSFFHYFYHFYFISIFLFSFLMFSFPLLISLFNWIVWLVFLILSVLYFNYPSFTSTHVPITHNSWFGPFYSGYTNYIFLVILLLLLLL